VEGKYHQQRPFYSYYEVNLRSSEELEDFFAANFYFQNLLAKVEICISAYSKADVVCYSATWRMEWNDIHLVVDRTFKFDDPRLKMLHSGCALVRHFQPRVHHI